MKLFILAAVFVITGCFSGSGGRGRSSDGEPEMFSVAASQPDSGGSAAASHCASSYEPQNVIRIYSAPPNQYCPPCQRLDAWLNGLTQQQREELSVEFIKAIPPAWVKSYPTLHWKVGDQWWKAEGWEGIEKFAITYNQSIKAGSKKKGGMDSAPVLLDVTNLSASSSEQIPASQDGDQETQFQSATGRASYCRGKQCYR